MTQTVPDISPLMPMHQDPLLVHWLWGHHTLIHGMIPGPCMIPVTSSSLIRNVVGKLVCKQVKAQFCSESELWHFCQDARWWMAVGEQHVSGWRERRWLSGCGWCPVMPAGRGQGCHVSGAWRAARWKAGLGSSFRNDDAERDDGNSRAPRKWRHWAIRLLIRVMTPSGIVGYGQDRAFGLALMSVGIFLLQSHRVSVKIQLKLGHQIIDTLEHHVTGRFQRYAPDLARNPFISGSMLGIVWMDTGGRRCCEIDSLFKVVNYHFLSSAPVHNVYMWYLLKMITIGQHAIQYFRLLLCFHWACPTRTPRRKWRFASGRVKLSRAACLCVVGVNGIFYSFSTEGQTETE